MSYASLIQDLALDTFTVILDYAENSLPEHSSTNELTWKKKLNYDDDLNPVVVAGFILSNLVVFKFGVEDSLNFENFYKLDLDNIKIFDFLLPFNIIVS
ncbi:7904_t:CDS:2 [Entrophospora sp. SA101]|nr:7904_t:CDS:2 [Entrophospora sp. SA101]